MRLIPATAHISCGAQLCIQRNKWASQARFTLESHPGAQTAKALCTAELADRHTRLQPDT